MLFYETVEAQTLELLKNLLIADVFKDLRLAGGTALALQIGHRKSIDLDLFGKIEADEFEIKKQLERIGKIQWIKKTMNIHKVLQPWWARLLLASTYAIGHTHTHRNAKYNISLETDNESLK